jgi:hypothetical protein
MADHVMAREIGSQQADRRREPPLTREWMTKSDGREAVNDER